MRGSTVPEKVGARRRSAPWVVAVASPAGRIVVPHLEL